MQVLCSAAWLDTVAKAAAVHSYAVALDWSVDTTSVRVEGLGSGAEYWFAVLVGDEGGHLALYPLSQVRLQDDSAPQAPSVTLWCLGYDSVWVTWEPGSDRGGGRLEYKLVLADSREAVDTPAKVDAIPGADLMMDWQDASAHLLTGLVPATTRYLALLVRDGAGLLSWVYPQELTTFDMKASTPGAAVEVVGEPSETSAKLRWGAASELHVEYRVAIVTDRASIDTVLEVSTAPEAHVISYSTVLTLNGLAPATRYWAGAMVKNLSGFAALYEPVSFHTADIHPHGRSAHRLHRAGRRLGAPHVGRGHRRDRS